MLAFKLLLIIFDFLFYFVHKIPMDLNSSIQPSNGNKQTAIPPIQLDFDEVDIDGINEVSETTTTKTSECIQPTCTIESHVDSIDSDFYSSLNSDCTGADAVVLGYNNTMDFPLHSPKDEFIATIEKEEQSPIFSASKNTIRKHTCSESTDFAKTYKNLEFMDVGVRRHSTESEILRELTNHTKQEDILRFSKFKNKKLKLEKGILTKSRSEDVSKPVKSPSRGLQRMKSLNIQSSSILFKQLSLPTIFPQNSPIPRVASSTIVSLLKGAHFPSLTDFVLVDCRFNYEVSGGSILNSNYCRTRKAIGKLYENLKLIDGNLAVIFYCEFSQNRSPTIASYFRQLDRLNSTYPKLTFPDTYILEGGYKGFWEHVNKPVICKKERILEHYSYGNDDENDNGRLNNKEELNFEEEEVGKVNEERKKLFSIFGYVSMWDNKYKIKCNKKNRNMQREWSKNVVNGLM